MKFQREKVLRAFVKAEGPTCVLLIVDLEVNPLCLFYQIGQMLSPQFAAHVHLVIKVVVSELNSEPVFCRCMLHWRCQLHSNLLT